MPRTHRSLPRTSSAPVAQRTRDLPGRVRARLDSELLTTFAILGICHSKAHISVGLTISISGQAPETIAATDDIAVRVDWLQHQLQQGPAVSPERTPIVICKDLGAASRWPDFGRMCVAVLGMRSMVNVEVPTPGIRASLSFYSAESDAFDNFDVNAALRLARLAESTVTRAMLDVRAVHETDDPTADASQAAIALATLMAVRRVGPAAGFALLHAAALHSGRSLFDVAANVVRNGALPDETLAATIRPPDDRPAASTRATEPVPSVGGPEMWRTPSRTPSAATTTATRRTLRVPMGPLTRTQGERTPRSHLAESF